MSLFSHPFKKLTLAAAFGIGYTLGAKAGRERYEQIKSTAQQVKDDPRVQDAAAKAEDLVRDTATTIKDDPRVQDVVHRAEGLVDDVKGAARDGDLVETAKHVADEAADAVGGTNHDADQKVSPLLADEHVESAEEVVYSSGPDIEETIDELTPSNDGDRI
jgi:hypothetical protein